MFICFCYAGWSINEWRRRYLRADTRIMGGESFVLKLSFPKIDLRTHFVTLEKDLKGENYINTIDNYIPISKIYTNIQNYIDTTHKTLNNTQRIHSGFQHTNENSHTHTNTTKLQPSIHTRSRLNKLKTLQEQIYK